jgi:diacylglycerol kinase (ATP)
VFADAEPDDGMLNLAVITAEGIAQWARMVGRTVAGSPEESPYFRVTKARKITVKLDRKVLYELDGGTRTKIKAYRLEVEPGAIAVYVPETTNGNGDGS